MSRLGVLFALIASTPVSAGCSADAVEETEPAITLSGTFIVRQTDDGRYQLFRSRQALAFTPARTLLFVDEYLAGVDGVEEGRRKAREHGLVLVQQPPWDLAQFTKNPHWVVWYRSLTDEERGSSGI